MRSLLESADTAPEAGRKVRIDVTGKTFPRRKAATESIGAECRVLGGIDGTAGLDNSRLKASQQASGTFSSVSKIERHGEAFAWKGQQANRPTRTKKLD